MAGESPEPPRRERRQFEPEDWSNAITIYTSNLGFRETEADVRAIFEPFGRVLTVSLCRRSGEFTGTAFVVMAQREEGLAAIERLNGTAHNDFRLTVEQSRNAYDPAYRRPRRRHEDRRRDAPPVLRRERSSSPRRDDRGGRRRDDDARRDAPVYEYRRDRDREREFERDRFRDHPRERESDHGYDRRQEIDGRRRYRDD
jgi:RNA recognition motif-containing protein